jgi:hypothetical protein
MVVRRCANAQHAQRGGAARPVARWTIESVAPPSRLGAAHPSAAGGARVWPWLAVFLPQGYPTSVAPAYAAFSRWQFVHASTGAVTGGTVCAGTHRHACTDTHNDRKRRTHTQSHTRKYAHTSTRTYVRTAALCSPVALCVRVRLGACGSVVDAGPAVCCGTRCGFAACGGGAVVGTARWPWAGGGRSLRCPRRPTLRRRSQAAPCACGLGAAGGDRP